MRSKWLEKTRKLQNFLKHANRDSRPNSEVEYSIEEIELLIQGACALYEAVTGKTSRQIVTFMIWFLLKNPKYIDDNIVRDHYEKGRVARYHENKKEYYKIAKEIAVDINRPFIKFKK